MRWTLVNCDCFHYDYLSLITFSCDVENGNTPDISDFFYCILDIFYIIVGDSWFYLIFHFNRHSSCFFFLTQVLVLFYVPWFPWHFSFQSPSSASRSCSIVYYLEDTVKTHHGLSLVHIPQFWCSPFSSCLLHEASAQIFLCIEDSASPGHSFPGSSLPLFGKMMYTLVTETLTPWPWRREKANAIWVACCPHMGATVLTSFSVFLNTDPVSPTYLWAAKGQTSNTISTDVPLNREHLPGLPAVV